MGCGESTYETASIKIRSDNGAMILPNKILDRESGKWHWDVSDMANTDLDFESYRSEPKWDAAHLDLAKQVTNLQKELAVSIELNKLLRRELLLYKTNKVVSLYTEAKVIVPIILFLVAWLVGLYWFLL